MRKITSKILGAAMDDEPEATAVDEDRTATIGDVVMNLEEAMRSLRRGWM
jgi:hypothetical protein